MATLLRWSRPAISRASFLPLRFLANGFDVIPDSCIFEEERFKAFKHCLYFPVKIGETLASRFQVVGKLGYGVSSTVWLARDLLVTRYVTLKVYTREKDSYDEFEIYKKLSEGNHNHPGYPHVRTALDQLTIPRQGGDHQCMVMKPMWDSFKDMLYRNPDHRFTPALLKGALIQLFLALDYLHSECHIVHTDIKADNIVQDIEDESILESFTKAEMEQPSPRKFVNGMPVFCSRSFERPKLFGGAVLGDYGSAVRGDVPQYHDAQPDVYRSPEVMLKTPWSYPIDIWNVGVMIWDLFEGHHLFYGQDPDGKGYSTRAHLAEVIGLLGQPPLDLVKRGERSLEFFSEEGKWKAEIVIPEATSLEILEERLKGDNKDTFLEFMRGMLQWRPEDRKTAKQLLKDPWLNKPCNEDEF